jgi:hypothetical protein
MHEFLRAGSRRSTWQFQRPAQTWDWINDGQRPTDLKLIYAQEADTEISILKRVRLNLF